MGRILAFAGRAPKIARDTFIAPDAVIIGDVEIGEGSSVWYGAIVRGDVNWIRIGRKTNIQDRCVCHVT
ncbi:MAG TPA: gamma carbonic anhydrase family protein, partial [Proteobacteria bacterium]|nr:gamma carbonic anhydrase family protein [Pseudomonadota bacterium]